MIRSWLLLWIGAFTAAAEGEYCDYFIVRQSSSFPGLMAELCILKSKHLENDSIILATQGGSDRLDHISIQAERWDGPVFVALLVQSNADKTHARQLVKQFPYVHLTLVQINGPMIEGYPTNFMRNVVLASIQLDFQLQLSPLVLLLDADAIPNQSEFEMRSSILVNKPTINDLYVVPAFDLAEEKSIPTSKSELVQLLQTSNKAEIMHAAHAASYSLDDLELWSSTSSFLLPYEYKMYREPYIVANLQVYLTHMFYERFVGRGYNKQAFHFELWASQKYRYRALPNSFVINLANPGTTVAMTSESTKQVWIEFRTCIAQRYGLLCRESFWRLCDERGMHCNEICMHAAEKKKKPANVAAPPPQVNNAAHCLHQSVDVVFSEQWELELLEYAVNSVLLNAKWATRILLPFTTNHHRHSRIIHVDNIRDAVDSSHANCFLYLPAGAFLAGEMNLQDYHVPSTIARVGKLWNKQELIDMLQFKDFSTTEEEEEQHELVLVLQESPQRALWELQWKYKGKYQWLVITSPPSPSLQSALERLFPWQHEEECVQAVTGLKH